MPEAAHAPDIVITQQERFHTVTVPAGKLVEVRLGTAAGMNPWTRPVSDDNAILKPLDPSQQPRSSQNLTVADYRALAAGTARLQSSASIHCGHSQMCPDLLQAWTVTVQVR